MNDKEQVLAALTLHDVYGEEPKRTGAGWKMRCPFHTEKTPSLQIYGDLSWHCFGGCSTGGDAFSFVMRRDGVDFMTALRALAAQVGVELTNTRSADDRISRVYKALESATEYYTKGLEQNDTAQRYLTNERGMSGEAIKRFRLGFTNGGSLIATLKQQSFTDEEIVSAGLAVRSEGGIRDFFLGKRVMFPIIWGGRIRGFGGRIIDNSNPAAPKYLNSPDSPVFRKGDLLYGFDGQAIKDAGYALVVEGYTDTTSCKQFGYKNAAAPLGTALTPNQVEQIRKYTDTVYLIFDGDPAGKAAALRAAKLLFSKWMKGGVVTLPEGQDPDSFLRSGGNLGSYLDAAIPFAVLMARENPGQRKTLIQQMTRRNSPFEVAEFLSCIGTAEDVSFAAELSAREALERNADKHEEVYRQGEYVVRRMGDYLQMYFRRRFYLSVAVEGDPKAQAASLVEGLMKLKEKKHRAGKAAQKEVSNVHG